MARVKPESVIEAKNASVSLMKHGCGLDASTRNMKAAMRRACEELVAEGWAISTKPVPWAKSGGYAASDKLKRAKKLPHFD
jgi:hypothetical protein